MDKLEILQKKLKRQERAVQLLERMVEDKTRELYLANMKVEEERNHLLAIFDSMPDPMVIISEDRRILFANGSFRERFGEVKNGRCFEVLHRHDKPCKHCINSKVLARNEAFHSEDRVLANDLTFEITKSRCRYRGDETSISVILHDITERKLAEEARS